MILRKGIKGEEEDVLECADSAFRPFRPDGFSFKNVLPRVYDNNLPFATYHHVLIDDGKMVATAGNLFRDIIFNNKKYKFSFVGSVGTIPGYGGRGCMSQILTSINEENNSVMPVFSCLTGSRGRYNNYGYEKCGIRLKYSFVDYFYKHHANSFNIELKAYDENELSSFYDLYLKNEAVICRSMDDFIPSLKRRYTSIFGAYLDNRLIGYIVYSNMEERIYELVAEDTKYIADIIYLLMHRLNKDKIVVASNSLNRSLNKVLEKISDSYQIESVLQIKIFKVKEFLELMIGLNLKASKINDLVEVYNIDGISYEIIIKDGNLNINETNKPYLMRLTKMELCSKMFSFSNLYDNDSRLFPLLFSINEADLF